MHASAQIDALQADAAARGDVEKREDLADLADTDVLAEWRTRICAWRCEARTAAQTAEVERGPRLRYVKTAIGRRSRQKDILE
jgi:hypothetical protein